MTGRPLSGRTVVVTREEPGELREQLEALGAEVVHVPLIQIVDAPDGGAGLRDALSRAGDYDWLIVTSPNGARRVAAAGDIAGSLRLAVVGRATEATLRELTGRDADLVPEVQRLEGLLEVFPRGSGRVLAARGDLADPSLVDGLQALGWAVDDVVAYRTVARMPTGGDRARVERAHVVTFASGSAARAWADAFGPQLTTDRGIAVVAIGPSSAAAARQAGIDVAAVAGRHSVDGLVSAVVEVVSRPD